MRTRGQNWGRVFRITAGVLLLVLLLYMCYNILLPNEHNVKVLMLVEGAVSLEQEAALKERLALYAWEDDTGQKADITLTVIAFDSLTNPSSKSLSQKRQEQLQSELASGEALLFLVDDSLYDYLESKNYLLDLRRDYPQSAKVDGYRYYIKGTAFARHDDLKNLPDDLAFCIRGDAGGTLNALALNREDRYRIAAGILDHIIKNSVLPVEQPAG